MKKTKQLIIEISEDAYKELEDEIKFCSISIEQAAAMIVENFAGRVVSCYTEEIDE